MVLQPLTYELSLTDNNADFDQIDAGQLELDP